MYGINVIYTMKPGKREEFLAGVTASGAQAAVRGEEGCLQKQYPQLSLLQNHHLVSSHYHKYIFRISHKLYQQYQ